MKRTTAEPEEGRLFCCLFAPVRHAPDFPLVARAGSFFAFGSHCLKSERLSKGAMRKGTPLCVPMQFGSGQVWASDLAVAKLPSKAVN